MDRFTDIVSLGWRCRGTRRLRDFFGTESAYPFDWWVSPIKGLARFLHDWDVDRLFDPEDLSEIRAGEHIAYIRQETYGLKFQHDFPVAERRIVPDWRRHLDSAKSRTRHLMDKFEALNRPDRRILFYRELAPTDRNPEAGAKILRREALARTSEAQSVFLLISPNGVKATGWRSLTIDDPGEEPWSGDPALWDAALSRLGYGLEPAARSVTDRLSA